MLVLDFEKPIYEIEEKIAELKELAEKRGLDFTDEIKKLEDKKNEILKKEFEDMSIDRILKIARHPQRPYTLDFVERIVDDFVEIHGDRRFGDDKAIVCGFGYVDGMKVAVMGHQKGKNTKDNLYRNFGMANPEGYRKALRLMKLAEKFRIPVVSFVDTPGAYPGIGAEERGQSQAIAENLYVMFSLKTPIIVVVTGEGGSGGALGIACGDKVGMLEFAIYSVISPEGCSSILWRDSEHAAEAAEAMRITARDLYEMGIVDEIIKEPLGGAHRNYDEVSDSVKRFVVDNLRVLRALSISKLLEKRWNKYRKMTTQFL